MRLLVVALSLVVALAVVGWSVSKGERPDPTARRRQPVALGLTPDGLLLVANRTSGSISVIDTEKMQLIGEADVGGRLSDLTVSPEGRVLVVDEEGHRLVELKRRGDSLGAVQRWDVPRHPVAVRVAADGRTAFVAGLWSQKLSVIDLTPGRPPKVIRIVNLTFAPRLILPLGNSNVVIVADAFGGRLAVVDHARGEVVSVRELPGHAVSGLALDGRELLLAHQQLSEKSPTTSDDIHWGNLVSTHLRTLRLESVLDPKADILTGGRRIELGHPGRGAADPSGLTTAGSRVVVTLGGVGEVSVGAAAGGDAKTIRVGARPTAVIASANGKRAFVADAADDAVAMIDVVAGKVIETISLGARPEPSPAERGERLFHDARLSHEGWLSCHSCHVDGHSNGLLADTLQDGDFGAPKRVPTLHGVKDTGPWGWDGGVKTLAEQVRRSLTTTMRGPTPTDEQVRDLTAYLESLPPAPPAEDESEAARRGEVVFGRQGCASCHPGPTYTTSGIYDVGLTDEHGRKRFNPPSLRGVSHAGAFFHDGRSGSLEDVLKRERHRLRDDVADTELADLLRFLRSQ